MNWEELGKEYGEWYSNWEEAWEVCSDLYNAEFAVMNNDEQDRAKEQFRSGFESVQGDS